MNEDDKRNYKNRLESILRHIKHVIDNCHILGYRLIELGEEELGKNLIANSYLHDNSKLRGVEWEHLRKGDEILSDVVQHHNHTNDHHPEYWGSIHEMPKVKIAEMSCDIVSRSQEFGSDIRNWLDNVATKKYNFDKDSDVYKKIKYYINLLLEEPF